MSQFSFLQAEFPAVFEHAARAEVLVLSDARGACFYGRLALETAVFWMFEHDRSLKSPFESSLAAHIAEPTFRDLVGQTLAAKARFVKDNGNEAVHGRKGPSTAQAGAVLRELFHFAYWLARTYARGPKPPADAAFALEAVPRTATVPQSTLAQLQEAARRYQDAAKAREAAEDARRVVESDRLVLEAEIKALRDEIAATKAANLLKFDRHDYRESETRDLFIDLLLREAGWDPAAPDAIEVPVSGMPSGSSEGFVDYVLWGDDGKPLGLVEAKRSRKDPRAGRQQAKLYADRLEAEYGQRPVIFYTNGYEHWLWDDTRHPPREIQGFLKRDELALMIQRRTSRKALAPMEIDRAIVERPYQERAIRRITEAFERDGQRKALLVMATGAGKTRTVIALADLLMRANWAKRVLFLADRTALVRQSAGAFRKHLPGAATVNLLDERAQEGRVYVSTYPTMMRLIDETDGERRFGVGHFDLIVIDEAHRSVYRKYRAIFEYFDCLVVGLTATPKDEIDRDTYRLFDLQTGVPTDVYGLDEAVRDGWLVPFKAVSLTTDFLDRGIRYDALSDDEKEAWDAQEWSEDGSVPAIVEAPAMNKWLFNADTVDKVLQHLWQRGQRVAGGDRLGKTIIFAKSIEHANFIVERFDANFPALAGHFCRSIAHQDSYAQSLIDDFSTPGKAPHIAVSVDMLDTGIDVPEIVNLVFFKVVRSKTKFWQMIGRGTRLCSGLFGPGQDKEFFSVFDWCRNFEFFNTDPAATDGAIGEPLGKRLFTARVELVGVIDEGRGAPIGQEDLPQPPTPVLAVGESGSRADAEALLGELRHATAEGLRGEVAGMSLDNFLVRPKRRYVEKFTAPAAWERLGSDAQDELVEHVAGLPSSVVDEDLAAKQFDLVLLRAQLALLRVEPIDAHRQRITQYASLLEEVSNVPLVAAELALIHEVQTDEFWQDVTPPMLETVRRRLRALVKLIELKKRPFVYTDFVDSAGPEVEARVSGVPTGTDLAAFKRKARQFLKPHEDRLAIQKLRRGDALTPTDLEELERIFVAAGVGVADMDVLRQNGGIGRFVRSLVGLDRAAVQRQFDTFRASRTLTANQIQFVDMIIEHLTARGAMEPGRLYESPFTDFNAAGVDGVFDPSSAAELIEILERLDRSAA